MPTESYGFTGGWQTFPVPENVTSVTVTLKGAGSGSSRGGLVEGRLAVVPLQNLWISIGMSGKPNSGANPGSAVFGGGGAGGRGRNGQGGDGGGGATQIRLGTQSGSLKAVAGGAGGASGDGGKGGSGGPATGMAGSDGTSGNGPITSAGGGTQTKGGVGGTSPAGDGYGGWGGGHNTNPKPAEKAPGTQILQSGGEGGSPPSGDCHGGGGGGGGYHPGGGGAASRKGVRVGGGGGGGSNYTGGLTAAKSERGTGATAGGSVVIKWGEPPAANLNPTPPTDVKIGVPGDTLKDAVDEASTRSTGTVRIEAEVNDPNPEDIIRMLVRWTSISNFAAYVDTWTGWFGNEQRAWLDLTGLAQDTHYFVRLYAQDNRGLISENFNSIDFWTNRGPTASTLISPSENANLPSLQVIGFSWTFEDLDTGDDQSGFQLQYRTTSTISQGAGPWVLVDGSSTKATSWSAPAGTFKGSTYYEWQVRTKDLQGRWSEWSFANSFFAMGTTSPPIPLLPVRDIAVDVTGDTTLVWRFVDYDAGDTQKRADIRWRLVGQDDAAWITRIGAPVPGIPGANPYWVLPAETFAPGYHYEWQARTYDTGGSSQSDWSASGTFWSIATPGSQITTKPVVANPKVQGALGCGSYRVFVYDQGGRTPRGEVTPFSALTFGRKRDDISSCLITSNGFGPDCCRLYAELRSWAHELVVFRDEKRVWEGPITRITYATESVEIEAKDVMVYLYRRIMRQGYNDSFQMVDPTTGLPVTSGGVQRGMRTVVDRATRIIVNALAPSDPNILPYLTALTWPDDAGQSRVVEDYSQTAWEQVDDLAATAGLDYTTVGRRIILWDTHRAIGRLPEMRDGDFDQPPVVTEYGMQTANYEAVTNGSGVWGAVRAPGEPFPNAYYGPVEMVASAYDEASSATDEALTPAARQALVTKLEGQALRNIAGRWPSPIVVRVPDNSMLNPKVPIGFDQLVPGVWIPLRSTGTCRQVAQWQKLDSVTVQVDPDGEKVQVVMSPAPGDEQDFDADAAAAEAAGA